MPEGDSVRLTLTGAVGDVKDELVVEIPIHPWGVPVFASASGTGSESTTVFVGLPAGRTYENPDMLIALSPSLRRMLIELALGRDATSPTAIVLARIRTPARILPPPTNTTADRAAELLAATSALRYLREARAAAAPEAAAADRTDPGPGRRTDRRAESRRRLALGGDPSAAQDVESTARPVSDRLTSAAVVWALASAEPLGLLTDPKVLDQAVAHLKQEFARINGSDLETRAALLHALSTAARPASRPPTA